MIDSNLLETIVALSTPPGIGALAIIRLSGIHAIAICNEVFVGKNLENQDSHTIHFGTIRDQHKIIDEVLVSIFRSPKSYTGENTIEISTHGSPYIQQQVIQLLIKKGARIASPGEFTLRAFLNNKLDLSQAEAVADLIASNSEASHELALKQLRGGFSNEIAKLRDELIHFASMIELELDFSEEDVEFVERKELKSLVLKLQQKLTQLISSFNYGNVIKKGVPVAIVGKPNTGKSTLLNQLLNEQKAIVTDIAGTTRDAVEDEIIIEGINFRFIDTAGIRDTTDTIESIGIEKTYEKVNSASVILYVIDVANASKTDIITDLSNMIYLIKGKNKHLIVIANKIDQCKHKDEYIYKMEGIQNVIYTVAKNGINVDTIQSKLIDIINIGALKNSNTIVSNARHIEALTKAHAALTNTLQGLDTNVTGDFLAMDIRQALHFLGLITGQITTEDLLSNIFSTFCIGK